MSRTFHHGERRSRVRELGRDHPRLRKLARGLIDLAVAQAEAEAALSHDQKQPSRRKTRRRRPKRGAE